MDVQSFGVQSFVKCAQLRFLISGPKQVSKHTHKRAQCGLASVGPAQAHSNKYPLGALEQETLSVTKSKSHC